MILARHPRVAVEFIRTLQVNPDTPSLAEAAGAARDLQGVMGFQPPSWEAMARGARPNFRELDDFVRGIDSRGWQHEASFRVEEFFRQEQVFPALSDSSCALLRSQGVRGRDGVVSVPDLPGDGDRFPFVPGPLVASPPVAYTLNRAYRPVWPSTRLFWPSPSSVRTGWGSRK